MPAHDVPTLCAGLTRVITTLKWDIDPCDKIDWQILGKSNQGRPLIYAEFGNPTSTNTTLVFSMVHSDEYTPLYVGIELAHWLKDHAAELADAHVIIAPLLNPDGLFRSPKVRTNARGVDINRNFQTKDWNNLALHTWKTKFKGDPRRFPGKEAASEPETRFQVDLIKKFQPKKILSIHAPLNFMDYDGPSALTLANFPSDYVKECLRLREHLKAITSGYFPGSLGNFAGQEMGIPTLTLELPSADPSKAKSYWKKFQSGIHSMIAFKLETPPSGVPTK